MTGFEMFIWIVLMCVIATPFAMFAWEQDKIAKIQAELLKEQLEINRRWDVMNKHASLMNQRITEIYNSSRENKTTQ
tara:strand:- start:18499 stop:18729 length:231 start_codon:yes stop_codon:yes gene_type:complete